MKINVINIHVTKPHTVHGDYIYIGRDGHHQFHYGNPFTHIDNANLATVKVATREIAVQAFEHWLRGESWLRVEQERRLWILDRIQTIAATGDDLTLGCFCSPKSCHGQVLAKLIAEARERITAF